MTTSYYIHYVDVTIHDRLMTLCREGNYFLETGNYCDDTGLMDVLSSKINGRVYYLYRSSDTHYANPYISLKISLKWGCLVIRNFNDVIVTDIVDGDENREAVTANVINVLNKILP